MLLTQTVRLKLNNTEREILINLCHLSKNKNLFNVGLYTVRQYFFQERRYLSYESNYYLCKENENYQLLAKDCGQQTLKYVDRCFKAFFRLLSMRRGGTYQEKVNLPRYLPKDGYFPLIIPIRARHDFAQDNWKFKIPTSRKYTREHGSVFITVPVNLRGHRIKEIRILPKQKGKFLDAAFVYETPEQETIEFKEEGLCAGRDSPASAPCKPREAIAIDLGLNNLATVVSSTSESFIIDGRWLKSKNQWFNKRRAKLVSHKDKQVIVGYNPTLKQSSNMGKRNNQNFVQIPIFTLRAKLESLCARYGLNYIEQEESYTSKASSLDRDEMPVYNADNPVKPKFSGRRVKRGLYKTKEGHLINADANGSLGIGLKSSYKEVFLRVSRVCLTQPVRINILRESPEKSA